MKEIAFNIVEWQIVIQHLALNRWQLGRLKLIWNQKRGWGYLKIYSNRHVRLLLIKKSSLSFRKLKRRELRKRSWRLKILLKLIENSWRKLLKHFRSKNRKSKICLQKTETPWILKMTFLISKIKWIWEWVKYLKNQM